MILSEKNVLNILDWDLMAATPNDFLTLFLNFGIMFSDDKIPMQDNPMIFEKPNHTHLK